MKKISVTIVTALLLFCVGCKTHCPEFPAELNYFPYYEGQELKFINSQNDIRNFVISNKENTKSYSFGNNCKCVCDAFSSFRTSENQDSISLNCNINIVGGRYNDVIASHMEISCYFQYSYYYSDYLSRELPAGKPYEELYDYLEDIITIEKENNKIVNKIVIVKGKGLVSYTTVDGEEWKLVE